MIFGILRRTLWCNNNLISECILFEYHISGCPIYITVVVAINGFDGGRKRNLTSHGQFSTVFYVGTSPPLFSWLDISHRGINSLSTDKYSNDDEAEAWFSNRARKGKLWKHQYPSVHSFTTARHVFPIHFTLRMGTGRPVDYYAEHKRMWPCFLYQNCHATHKTDMREHEKSFRVRPMTE